MLWHVTRWGLGQFLVIASRTGKHWVDSAVPNNSNLQWWSCSRREFAPQASQRYLLIPESHRTRKPGCRHSNPTIKHSITGACVGRLGHSFLDYKICLYGTGQHWESFSGRITRTSTCLFISMLCSQLLHTTHWTHLLQLPLYLKGYICPSWRSKLLKSIGKVVIDSNVLLCMYLDVSIVSHVQLPLK